MSRLIDLIDRKIFIDWELGSYRPEIGIYQYLIDGTFIDTDKEKNISLNDEVRRKNTPNFMKWIESLSGNDYDLLLKILELNLFEIQIDRYDEKR